MKLFKYIKEDICKFLFKDFYKSELKFIYTFVLIFTSISLLIDILNLFFFPGTTLLIGLITLFFGIQMILSLMGLLTLFHGTIVKSDMVLILYFTFGFIINVYTLSGYLDKCETKRKENLINEIKSRCNYPENSIEFLSCKKVILEDIEIKEKYGI